MTEFAAGQTLLAATLESLVSAWTDYTPTWTGSGSDPVINDGVIVGRYKAIGKTCHFIVTINVGAATTVGTGFYTVSLPVASSASALTALPACQFFDASAAGAAQYSVGFGQLGGGGTTVIRMRLVGENNANATINNWSATYPVAPAVGDQFSMQGTYEVA